VTASASTPPGGPWAHSANESGEWHALDDHLSSVGRLARTFAEPFGGGDLADLAGRWHDAGKYSKAFQAYISAQGAHDSHAGEAFRRIDHSSAGAQHAVASIPIVGHLLAYAIAGHHSGLLDERGEGPSLDARLTRHVEEWMQYVIAAKSRPARGERIETASG
jgi:CRISPR-associated endonuclease/helicase Cas3